jgi:hypothetical protein
LRWDVFCKRGIAHGANGSRTANSVKRIFGTSFWPPIGAIFKPKIVRETTTYWGWLQPSKSYDFVPIPVIRHPSISLLICEPYLQFKEFWIISNLVEKKSRILSEKALVLMGSEDRRFPV